MLEIKGLTKTFLKGTPNAHTALDGVDLTLDDGEFVTVIGSNGAGKSTLFGAIGGSFYPDSGKILLAGKDITYQHEHRRARMISRIFQDPMKGTAPSLTIEENLALAYTRAHRSPFSPALDQKTRALFRDALAALGMGLEERMRDKIGLLSGGQRQAVSLLMSTIAVPQLLLLDEHTAALDPATAEKILAITQTITERDKITTMMITHNITSALKLGTRTIMLERGRIVLDLKGHDRAHMTVQDLMELYRRDCGKELDNDRMLFS